MKVNLKELVEVLEKVFPAIGIGGLVPEYKCFHIHGNEVWTTDGTVTISCSSGPDTGLECAVLGAPFLHLLRSLSESVKKVDLIYKNNEVKVKTNKVKGIFTTLSSENVKKSALRDSDTVAPDIYTSLFTGLGFCKFGVSKDETLGPLCGVMIDKDVMLSSDRYRIASYQLEKEFPAKCSLPLKFIGIMIRNKQDIESLSYIPGEKFIATLKDGTCISTTILVGEHPDLLKYFPDKSISCKEVTLVDSLAEVLERHISFLGSVDPVDKEILVKVGKNKCTLTSTDKELGELIEEVEVRTEEDSEIEFSINPVFLKEIVRLCDRFKYYTENKIVLFEAEGLRYLVQTRE